MTLLPVAHAAVDATAFGRVVDPVIENIVNPLIVLLFAVGTLVFVYGVFQVVWGGEEARQKGKVSMIGGVVGMFLMLSAWGIVRLISNTVAGI